MDKVGFHIFNYLRSFHFRQIKGQGNVVVEGKGKALCVFDWIPKRIFGQFFCRRFGIDRQNFYVISCFGQKFEHFLKAIGVSRNVGKGSGLYHQADLARRTSSEGRNVRATRRIFQGRAGMRQTGLRRTIIIFECRGGIGRRRCWSWRLAESA